MVDILLELCSFFQYTPCIDNICASTRMRRFRISWSCSLHSGGAGLKPLVKTTKIRGETPENLWTQGIMYKGTYVNKL
jgi:hypothetical protein